MFAGFTEAGSTIKYVAVGDSYSIGTGAPEGSAWPQVMTAELRSRGRPIELTANLGQNGWTTAGMILAQMPQLAALKPDLVTVMGGANDASQMISEQEFAQRFNRLLDDAITVTGDAKRVIVITIPDFSVTPAFRKRQGNYQSVIKNFNSIIIQTADQRGCPVVDVYPASQEMGEDPSLVSEDGLHPSAKMSRRWANTIGAFIDEHVF
jgi:lysophospholipase L1-like esterase